MGLECHDSKHRALGALHHGELMDASTSVGKALLDIFVAPTQALRGARQHTQWFWLPLLLWLGSTIALIWFYYLNVDMNWLTQHLLSMSGKQLTQEQMEQIGKHMTRTPMLIGGTVGAIVVPVVWNLLGALYLHIVDKSSVNAVGNYGKWFALLIWSSFPQILASIAAIINFATAAGPIGPEQLSVTNLNSLLFHLPLTHSWAKLLGGLDITFFWTLGLAGLGVSLWTNRPYAKSLGIAAVPYIVIYGLWALVIAIF